MDVSFAALPAPAEPVVEVFWRPGCPFCAALRLDLTARRVSAVWRDIWQDEEARAVVRAANDGNETVPTVRVGSAVLTNPTGREVLEAMLGRQGSVARRRRVRALWPRTAHRG